MNGWHGAEQRLHLCFNDGRRGVKRFRSKWRRGGLEVNPHNLPLPLETHSLQAACVSAGASLNLGSPAQSASFSELRFCWRGDSRFDSSGRPRRIGQAAEALLSGPGPLSCVSGLTHESTDFPGDDGEQMIVQVLKEHGILADVCHFHFGPPPILSEFTGCSTDSPTCLSADQAQNPTSTNAATPSPTATEQPPSDSAARPCRYQPSWPSCRAGTSRLRHRSSVS